MGGGIGITVSSWQGQIDLDLYLKGELKSSHKGGFNLNIAYQTAINPTPILRT